MVFVPKSLALESRWLASHVSACLGLDVGGTQTFERQFQIPWRIHGAGYVWYINANMTGGILMGSMLPLIWQHHGSYGDRMSEDMADRLPEKMRDRMSGRMSNDMSDRMPDGMPERMSKDMSDRHSMGLLLCCLDRYVYLDSCLKCHGGYHSKFAVICTYKIGHTRKKMYHIVSIVSPKTSVSTSFQNQTWVIKCPHWTSPNH